MSGLSATVQLRVGDFTLDARFQAASGYTTVLLGPNGAGKSTLLAALAGLLRPSSGRVVLDGRVLDDPAAAVHIEPRKRDAGVVFSDGRLFPALDVRGNVAYGLRARGVRRAEANARADALLEQLGLAGLARRRVASLSGGEAQRVALARALAPQPRLLLLDEPLSALDVRNRAGARALLRRSLAGAAAVRLLVTHDPIDALALADNLVVVERGRVVQAGGLEEVRRAPRSAFAAALLGRNVLRGTLARDARGTRVVGADGELAVIGDGIATGQAVLATFPLSAVALFDAQPHTSARNLLSVVVSDLEAHGDRLTVRLASQPGLAAEVTAAAVADLHLAPGRRLWAAVKATEITVEPL